MQIWRIGQNDKEVLWGSYTICLNGITIPSISPDTLWGAGLSILSGSFLIQLIVTNHINAVRWGESEIFSKDWHPF